MNFGGFQWNVAARPSAKDHALADEQRRAASELVGGIENLTEAVEHLDLAFFRGFAHVQPIWLDDGTVREIFLPESWTFLRRDGAWYHNPKCTGFNADAQMDVWKEVVARDASVVAAAINRGLVRPFLEAKFPGRHVEADFVFDTAKRPTAKEVAEVASTLKNAGYVIVQDELEEAVGFTLEKAPEQSSTTGGLPFMNKSSITPETKKNSGPEPTPTPADDHGVLAAFAKDTGPAAAAIARLLQNPSPEAAARLLKELPDLIPDDPALAAVIADAMAAEFASALSQPSHQSQPSQNAPLANKNGERCKDCGQWLDGNGVCHECRGRDELASDGYNPDDEKMQSAEIGKGKAAVRKCLDEGVDCYDAISRSDIGSISLIYGQPVDDDSGRAFGLSHLFHKHQGEGIVENLAESLIRGKVREPGKSGNKIAIDYKGYQIHLAKSFSRKGNPNTDKVTWVITGFKTDKEDA